MRVRRLEVHGEERDDAYAGERTSLNLAGVERATLRRGQALVARGGARRLLRPHGRSHVAARPSRPRSRTARACASTSARPTSRAASHRLAGPERPGSPAGRAFSPGSTGFAQITLESPLPRAPGRPLRPPPALTRRDGRRRARARRRAPAPEAPERRGLDRALSRPREGRREGPRGPLPPRGGPGRPHGRAPRAPPRRRRLLPPRASSTRSPPRERLFASRPRSTRTRAPPLPSPSGRRPRFAERRKSGTASVSFGKGEFSERLARGLSPAAADGWIAVLAASKKLALDGDRVVPPGAKAADLEGDAASFAAKISRPLSRGGVRASAELSTLAGSVGTKPAVVDGLVSHLVKSGVLVRLSPDLVVHRDVAAAAEKKLETVRGQTLGGRRLSGPPRPHAQDAHPAARVLRLEEAHAAVGRRQEGRVVSSARRFFLTTRSLFFFAESSV